MYGQGVGPAIFKVSAQLWFANSLWNFVSHVAIASALAITSLSSFGRTVMRNGWVEKRLDEIGTLQTGSTPKTSENGNVGDFIPFVKPSDFATDGSVGYANNGLSEVGLAKARRVPAGSVLMVCIGATIGKCGYCDRDVTTNQQINSLTPVDKC